MQETSRYAVGIDIGTTTVRCVVGHLDATTGAPTIVGVGQAPNSGMRKGIVANLTGPAQAIDDALGEAERMSGYQVNAASISINGAHILSTKADGMIAVGGMDHEITPQDLARIEEVATLGKVPANREILEVVPHSYRLDGQDNIKDPLGMTGNRLEISANVVSALAPHLSNLQRSAEMAKVEPRTITPAILGAARAVLSEQQIENGVAVVDLGGATTSIAIFEEGDLQYVAVIPVGGVNITNDLAIGLKTDPEIAEKVKLANATAVTRKNDERISIKIEKETHNFDSSDVDEIVGARLDEIFDAIQKELKKAGRAGKLPSGVVLTGGTAKIKGIAEYTKEKLGLAARVGKSSGYGGVADNIEEPQFATVVGLMLLDSQGATNAHTPQKSGGGSKAAIKNAGGVISKFLDKFKA
ncbi:MAG TPA: cell division protein FtsA [Candidatus Saccharimonadales bacterium]|nr:cell division protein FtsA [Candidatus Saccharimonadales bacterium]